MRSLFLAGASVLALALGAAAQQRPDFSGTWKLDPLRSRIDKGIGLKSATLRIVHQEPKLVLAVKSEGKTGARDYELELITGGGEASQTVEGRACVATAEWGYRTGERLSVELKCESADGPVVTTRVLKLGGKGKFLTTVLTMRTGKKSVRASEFYVPEAGN